MLNPDYGQRFCSACCCCCLVTSVVSDSVRPHRRQPTRLLCPWDSPGKNTGVGCHFLLQCLKVKSESEVAHLCLTLCDPTDRSPPGCSVHGILQARILEWGAIALISSETSNSGRDVLSSHSCVLAMHFLYYLSHSFVCNYC